MYVGSFDHALQHAEMNQQWLLVNIQQNDEFACHALNRDIWNNISIQQLIADKFILWQQQSDTSDAQQYRKYYNITSYPHIAIVDPRTKQKLAQYQYNHNTKQAAQLFIEYINNFINTEGMPTNTTATTHSNNYINSSGSSAAELVDLTRNNSEEWDDVELTEDEQLQLAIQQSMVDSDDEIIKQEADSNNDPIMPANDNNNNNTSINSYHNDNNNNTVSTTNVKTGSSHTNNNTSTATAVNNIKCEQIYVPPEPAAATDVTRLQFRIDDKRIQRRFYKADTINILYNYVMTQLSSDQQSKQFILVTSHPKRCAHIDQTQTLQDAGLLNASIVVEWT